MKAITKYLLLAGVVSLLNTASFASDPATWGPVYADGPCKNLHKDECEFFQHEKQKRATQADAEELKHQQGREQEAAYQTAKQDAKEKQEAKWAADYAKQKADDDARQAEYKRQSEADDRRYLAAERKAATEASARKEKCGDDYKSPKIGMSIDRVRACVTPVKVTAQLSRVDGVVTTYEGGGAYFHVMDGRVLGWGKY